MKIDGNILAAVAFRRSNLLTVTLFLLVLTSCKKENDQAMWDVDVLAPIAHTTLTISDLIPDSIQSIGPDNGITLVYKDVLIELRVDTLFDIPDTNFVYPYALPVPGPVTLTAGTNVLNTVDESNFGLDPIELTQAVIRSGEVQVSARSMVNTPTVADLSLLSASLGGSTLQLDLNIPAGTQAQPSIVSESRDISGYDFDMRGQQLNDVNTLSNRIIMSTAPNAPDVAITNLDSLIATISYTDVVPEYAKGYLGQQLETVNEEISIDAFDNISGTFDLDQVKIILKIDNGLGVDARLNISDLNSIGNSNVGLNHQIMNGAINISRATDLGGTGFVPSTQSIVLDNSNSNIDLFVENLPQQLQFNGDLEINPLGNISNGNDFIYHDSRFEVSLCTEIPLCIIASNAIISSVAEIDLPGTSQQHGITSGVLNLFVDNAFPLGGTLEMEIFEDVANVFPIPVSNSIPVAQLDMNGEVIGPSTSKLSIELNADEVDRLYQAGKVRLTMRFDTAPTGQHAKFKDTHFMNIQMTADFNYIVNGDG